jgi:hypothetical protein
MTTGRSIHRASTFVLSFLMLVIGIALVVQALIGHGGAVSGRMLLGLLFIAAGVARGYLEVRRGRGA